MTLSISTLQTEGMYQASKWLKIQALLDAQEMQALLQTLDPLWIFPLTGIHNGEQITKRSFLQEYQEWIEGLKQGKVPSSEQIRRILSCCWVNDVNALWLQKVGEGKFLTKIRKPVIQVQTHWLTYSRLDRVFRSMSMGKEGIFWGLQFSFPQIYQDPKSMELLHIGRDPLFHQLQRWMREHTVATPFEVDGEKKRVPVRLGKTCFCWIAQHPQLMEQKIQCIS